MNPIVFNNRYVLNYSPYHNIQMKHFLNKIFICFVSFCSHGPSSSLSLSLGSMDFNGSLPILSKNNARRVPNKVLTAQNSSLQNKNDFLTSEKSDCGGIWNHDPEEETGVFHPDSKNFVLIILYLVKGF